jgi:hypothetical protein
VASYGPDRSDPHSETALRAEKLGPARQGARSAPIAPSDYHFALKAAKVRSPANAKQRVTMISDMTILSLAAQPSNAKIFSRSRRRHAQSG